MNSPLITTSFLWVLETTWQASLLALLVMLIQRATRKSLSPQARHALWLLVVARLLLPVLPASPTSLAGLTDHLPARLIQLADQAFFRRTPDAATEIVVAPAPLLRGQGDGARVAPTRWSERSWPNAAANDNPVRAHGLPADKPQRGDSTIDLLCGVAAVVWLVGVLACLARGTWCWRRFRRQFQRDAQPADSVLIEMLAETRRQLGMRRRVQLAITSIVATPAVTGVWRPTILLPPRVAAELSPAELRLVLLHELAHLRRGDGLLGWLAAGLTAVHWFNPLLRHVFSRMRQLRELACDQAVVAAIGQRQARDYGRTIVHVLELLEDVSPPARAAPIGVTGMAFWFGRDTDSIQERIRMLTHDAALPRRRRTLLAVLLMTVLAAVGLTDGGERSPPPLKLLDASADSPKRTAQSQTAKDVDGDQVTHVYEAKDVYQGIKHNDDKSHREYIANWLQAATSPQGRGSYRWLDGHLVVKQTPEVHKRLASALKHLREFGAEQIAVEVVLLSAPEDVVQAIPADWVLQPVQSERIAQPDAANRLSQREGTLPTEAHTITRKELPVMLQVVDDDEAARLMDQFQNHPRANILSRPKIMTLNGQSATLSTGVQRPFVVGLQDGEPQIRVIDEGTVMRLCPLLVDAETAWLDCELELPLITKVETAEVRSRDGKPVTLQVPEVETTRLRTSVSLPLDKTLLLGGVKAREGRDGWNSLVVLVRARKVDDLPQETNNDSVAHPPTWSDIAAEPAARTQEGQILPSPRLWPEPKTAIKTPKPAATGRMMFGVGVNSDAGVSGSIVVEEDNFKQASHSPVLIKTYNVADLVIPIPNYLPSPRKESGSARDGMRPPRADFESLTDLITSTIAPDSWEGRGGEGSVRPFEANLSLVISHTESVHNQVADLLGQLRKQREVQVALELRLFQYDDRAGAGQATSMTFESLVLKPGSAAKLTESLLEDAAEISLPKITLFDHQTAEVSDPHHHIRLRIGPAIAADRRSVSLTLAVGTSDARYRLTAAGMAQVSDRGTVVWDLSDKLPKSMTSGGRIFLTATPTIVVPQEEEERLEPKINWSSVTPPMIFGEEESLLESDVDAASAGSKRP